MKTIDTCGQKLYSPLIPAVKAMCETAPGEKLEIIMNNAEAFQDLKEYLAETEHWFPRNIRRRTDDLAVQDIIG